MHLCRKSKRNVLTDAEQWDENEEEEQQQNDVKRDADGAKVYAGPRKGPTRNMLWFQTSDRRCRPSFMKIPLHEDNLSDKWVKGKCMKTMGMWATEKIRG